MTRAKTDHTLTPWFAKAGAASSIVPVSRFVGSKFFALKTGGYGCLFSLSGIDEEGLTDQELESQMAAIEGALRGLPEGSCLYQYSRVLSGYELPRQRRYDNPVTESFVTDRLSFLDKTAKFRRIDLYWCLTLEPQRANPFERKPQENAIESSRMLAQLEKTAEILETNLAGSIGLRLLGKEQAYQFFSYLFNLEPWAEHDQLQGDTGVDRQIVKSPVSWDSDHLRVGKRQVQMFSLKNPPEASRPCLFSDLMTLDCDSVLCSTWRPKSAQAARKEIDQQEKFISFFKVSLLARVMSGRDCGFARQVGRRQGRQRQCGRPLSDVIRSLDKKAQGEYTLRLSAGRQKPGAAARHHPRRSPDLRRCPRPGDRRDAGEPVRRSIPCSPAITSSTCSRCGWERITTRGCRRSSLRILAIPIQKTSTAEYLNIFETRTRTPFFQDVYVNGVRVMLDDRADGNRKIRPRQPDAGA